MKTIPVKNLSHLKRLLHTGAEYRITAHAYHPKYIGLVRVVDKVQTNGVYSKIKDRPDHPLSTSNYGKGIYTPFEKASRYIFGDTVKALGKDGKQVIYEFEVLENVKVQPT